MGKARSQQSMQMPPDPANVLIIVLDDIGVDQIYSYWEHYPELELSSPCSEEMQPITPSIDALAAAGTRFTNAWSSPVCTPTRAQIMTGMRPSQTGMGTAFNRVEHPDWPGLPAGSPLGFLSLNLNSAAVGKWHLAGLAQQNGHPCEYGGFGSFLGTFYNVNAYGDASTDIECNDTGPFMCWNRFECGSSNPELVETYATAQTTDDAIAKMDALDAGSEPWLLYVAYHASHAPYHCPPDALYEGESGWLDSCAGDVASGCHGDPVYQTRAMTQALDIEIGRLLDYLDELGESADDNNYEDTAVILISDNGTPGEATVQPFPKVRAKATPYQGGINVPLIIRAPGPPNPKVTNALVSASDVFATTAHFLHSLGYENQLNIPNLDSRSVASHVSHEYVASQPREYLYSESFAPNFNRLPNGDLPVSYRATDHKRAVRNDMYKLVDLSETSRKFYSLWDPDLDEHQYPAPQDPSILDPESMHSPYESTDLLGVDRGSWPQFAEAAYEELSEQLDSLYPPLPGEGVAPSLVRSTDGTSCNDSDIFVSREAGVVSRAFVEFSLPADIDQVHSAHLFVAGVAGGSETSRTIKVWPMDQNVSDYASDCEGLFSAIDPIADAPYAEVDDWTATNFGKVIHLAGDAVQHILNASAEEIGFSVGITLGNETQDYSVQLQPFWAGGPDPESEEEGEHRLILRYTTSSGKQQTTQIPPTPARENTLAQSYPNPFNPTATIAYAVKERSHVALRIYDASGALVRTLVDHEQAVGDGYTVVWDGRNDAGQPVSSGVYFYRLAIGDFIDSKKMVLLK